MDEISNNEGIKLMMQQIAAGLEGVKQSHEEGFYNPNDHVNLALRNAERYNIDKGGFGKF
jgi:hypothetical protein